MKPGKKHRKELDVGKEARRRGHVSTTRIAKITNVGQASGSSIQVSLPNSGRSAFAFERPLSGPRAPAFEESPPCQLPQFGLGFRPRPVTPYLASSRVLAGVPLIPQHASRVCLRAALRK